MFVGKIQSVIDKFKTTNSQVWTSDSILNWNGDQFLQIAFQEFDPYFHYLGTLCFRQALSNFWAIKILTPHFPVLYLLGNYVANHWRRKISSVVQIVLSWRHSLLLKIYFCYVTIFKSLLVDVMFCAIWYHFYNLKKRKKHPWMSFTCWLNTIESRVVRLDAVSSGYQNALSLTPVRQGLTHLNSKCTKNENSFILNTEGF